MLFAAEQFLLCWLWFDFFDMVSLLFPSVGSWVYSFRLLVNIPPFFVGFPKMQEKRKRYKKIALYI